VFTHSIRGRAKLIRKIILNTGKLSSIFLAISVLLAVSAIAHATTAAMFDNAHTRPGQKEFSPYVNRGYPPINSFSHWEGDASYLLQASSPVR
jgi:hypothetical protein